MSSRRPLWRIACLFLALSLGSTAWAGQGEEAPLRVFLRAGPKTHGAGEHDHPRFLEEWKRLLAERGAEVEGALRFPSAEELSRTDVLVCYAAEGASIHGSERDSLLAYLSRGGGMVVLHDALCGDDPQWFQSIVGGAWEHGHSKWFTGRIGLYFDAQDHPITAGTSGLDGRTVVANFDLTDELYHDLHLSPDARVLATGFHSVFDVTPQMWVFERQNYRAFVAVQGHFHETFAHPAWRTLLRSRSPS
jgi:type 1 glutamine amidotransferase